MSAIPTTESLKEAVKKQIEYYFSKQNLTHDSYLVSQMDAQMYVSLDVLVTFSKIKELTQDVSLLREALKDSSIVSLNEDENSIKPNIKSERTTIILREIPSDTNTDDVRALFSDTTVVSIRSDVGDTWFVTLSSEAEAVTTVLHLRNKSFNNAPIKARLKSENLLRSLLPVNNASSTPAAASSAKTTNGYYAPPANTYYQQNTFQSPYQQPYHRNYDQPRYERRSKPAASGHHQSRYPPQQQSPATTTTAPAAAQAAATPIKERKHASARKHKEKRSHKHDKKPQFKKPVDVLNATNFPPLQATAATPAIVHSYSEEDIMEVVKHMRLEDCALQKGKMDLPGHPAALNVLPHQNLLKSQRTYSIEQAREALRQGRPIRSDSVGSMDYDSMMYGEDYTKEARAARSRTTTAAVVVSPAVALAIKRTEPQMEPHPKKVGGYAAALLSSPTVAVVSPDVASPAVVVAPAAAAPRSAKKEDKKRAAVQESDRPVVEHEAAAVVQVEDPSVSSPWAKRSFVEVLKTEKSMDSKPAAVNNNSSQ